MKKCIRVSHPENNTRLHWTIVEENFHSCGRSFKYIQLKKIVLLRKGHAFYTTSYQEVFLAIQRGGSLNPATKDLGIGTITENPVFSPGNIILFCFILTED